jgi:hypothetical protein
LNGQPQASADFTVHGPQSAARESLDAEVSAAKAWLDAHAHPNPNVEIRNWSACTWPAFPLYWTFGLPDTIRSMSGF